LEVLPRYRVVRVVVPRFEGPFMRNEELETSKASIKRLIDAKFKVVSQVALREHRDSFDVFTAKDMIVELLEEIDGLDGALSDFEETSSDP
jgi:hypothetical protein